jgi:hypothetical protein
LLRPWNSMADRFLTKKSWVFPMERRKLACETESRPRIMTLSLSESPGLGNGLILSFRVAFFSLSGFLWSTGSWSRWTVSFVNRSLHFTSRLICPGGIFVTGFVIG